MKVLGEDLHADECLALLLLLLISALQKPFEGSSQPE